RGLVAAVRGIKGAYKVEMGEVNMFGDERDNEKVEEERELSAKEAADEKESLSLGNNKEESNRQVRSSNVRMGRLERKG
ncbi:hypothetical protein BHE74_00037924, partial [Ensete ventricosum]